MTKLKSGFTLVELLVVVSLIGVLSTLVIANLNSARERARDAERKSDLRNIQTALRLYYNDAGRYPAGTSTMTACGTGTSPSACSYGSVWDRSGTTYMNILPKDPLSPTQDYVYTYIDDDNYVLRSCLENKSDDKGVSVATSICASGYKYEVKP